MNPNGRSTSWYVEFGTSTSYGVEDLVAERRLGDGDPHGRRHRLEPEARAHLPLPARRHELARDDARRGCDVHDDRRAARRHRAGQLRDAVALVGAGQRHRQSTRPRRRPGGSSTVARAATGSGQPEARVDAARPTCGSHPLLTGPLARQSAGTIALVARSAAGTSVGRMPRSPPRRGRSIRPAGRCAARSSGPRPPTSSAGTRGRDVICGLGGNDRILGGRRRRRALRRPRRRRPQRRRGQGHPPRRPRQRHALGRGTAVATSSAGRTRRQRPRDRRPQARPARVDRAPLASRRRRGARRRRASGEVEPRPRGPPRIAGAAACG